MSFEELDVIKEFTGCEKPCKYLEYKFLKEMIPSDFDPSGDYFVFTIVTQTRYTTVEKEELLYPSFRFVYNGRRGWWNSWTFPWGLFHDYLGRRRLDKRSL